MAGVCGFLTVLVLTVSLTVVLVTGEGKGKLYRQHVVVNNCPSYCTRTVQSKVTVTKQVYQGRETVTKVLPVTKYVEEDSDEDDETKILYKLITKTSTVTHLEHQSPHSYTFTDSHTKTVTYCQSRNGYTKTVSQYQSPHSYTYTKTHCHNQSPHSYTFTKTHYHQNTETVTKLHHQSAHSYTFTKTIVNMKTVCPGGNNGW